MSQLLVNNRDYTENVLYAGQDSASITDLIGLLTKQRPYIISDNDGFYSFLSNKGILSAGRWRGVTIKETSDNGQAVFDGIFEKPSLQIDKGFNIQLEGKEPLAVYLNADVETNSIFEQDGITGLTLYDTSGTNAKGATTINLTYTGSNPSAVTIPVGSCFTYDNSLIPRYMVLSESGSGSPYRTTSITIDRPLEEAITAGTQITISEASYSTGPAELIRVFTALGLGEKLGASFWTIDSVDSAANRKLYLNIKREDGVKTGEHIRKILELCDLNLIPSASGAINLSRGRAFDGNEPIKIFSEADLIPPLDFYFSVENLIAGYDCLYIDSLDVKIASGDADQEFIDLFDAVEFWQPIEAGQTNIIEYKYLYNNATTADYFGQRRIDYYKAPRLRLRCAMPRNANLTKRFFSHNLFDKVGLTIEIAKGQYFAGEPAIITGYTYNDKELYYSEVEFEFTNYFSPNIIRDTSDFNLQTPVIEVLTGYFGAFYVQTQQDYQKLYFDIYLEDEETLIFTGFVDANPDVFFSELLESGDTFKIKFYGYSYGVFSSKTDFYTLQAVLVASNVYGDGIYGISQYGT